MTDVNIILAPIGKRFSAKFIDSSISFIVGYSALLLVSKVVSADSVVPLVLMYALMVICSLFADGLFVGQSIGKKLLKIYVVSYDTNEPCNYRQSFIRNITTYLWIFDIIPIVFNSEKRRYGDYLAKTKVIMKI